MDNYAYILYKLSLHYTATKYICWTIQYTTLPYIYSTIQHIYYTTEHSTAIHHTRPRSKSYYHRQHYTNYTMLYYYTLHYTTLHCTTLYYTSISLKADGPSLPSCLWSLRIFPSLPGSLLTIFYRDASSAILQLVNQWLNFTCSRSHAFRTTSRCAGYLLAYHTLIYP